MLCCSQGQNDFSQLSNQFSRDPYHSGRGFPRLLFGQEASAVTSFSQQAQPLYKQGDVGGAPSDVTKVIASTARVLGSCTTLIYAALADLARCLELQPDLRPVLERQRGRARRRRAKLQPEI